MIDAQFLAALGLFVVMTLFVTVNGLEAFFGVSKDDLPDGLKALIGCFFIAGLTWIVTGVFGIISY